MIDWCCCCCCCCVCSICACTNASCYILASSTCYFVVWFCNFLFSIQLIWSDVPPFCPMSRVTLISCLLRHGYIFSEETNLSSLLSVHPHSRSVPPLFGVDATMANICPCTLAHNSCCSVLGRGFNFCFCFFYLCGKAGFDHIAHLKPPILKIFVLTYIEMVECSLLAERFYDSGSGTPLIIMSSSWFWNKLTGFLRSCVVETNNIK